MGNALTIHLEDDVYSRLVQAGRMRGQTIESVASRLVDDSLTDPLLSLSGCLEFSRPDTTLEIAEDLGAFLAADNQPVGVQVRELIVLDLYRHRRISSGKAAELLAETREDFLDRAARAGIPYLDLSPADLAQEFDAAERYARAHNL